MLSDFLTFTFFISPYVLITAYYLGALVLPAVSWFVAQWAWRKFGALSAAADSVKEVAQRFGTRPYRGWFFAGFTALFIMMEVVWRMMFEFMIAYFQMREALLQLTT